MNENELMHYGVIGMRWGRRKGISSAKSKTNGQKTKGKKAAKIALGVIGTATVATIATAAVTRRAAKYYTILGMSNHK